MKRILFVILILIGAKLEAQTKVDHLSMITTKVLLLKSDSLVSQGTGFFFITQDTVNKQSTVFLVTNYHVLTGSAPEENKAPIGDNIIFFFHKDQNNTSDLKQIRFPLFTKTGRPIWVSSSKYKSADIAIIPLPTSLYSDCKLQGISEEWAKSQIVLHPTSSLTLIGYPYGFSDTKNALPIWKTGTIASEPLIDFDGKPLFLVDISAFPGMSGSPAFAIAFGMYEVEQGSVTPGSVKKFLGIYASMQMLEEKKYLEQLDADKKEGIKISESLELGHIWKADLIIDIINGIDKAKYENEILKNL